MREGPQPDRPGPRPRLSENVQDDRGCGYDRRVVNRMGAHPGLHKGGDVPLIVLNDQAALLGHQEPGRAVP